ncbi:DUF7134 domain-containing protein, partial [Actinomadura welshii]
MAAATVRLHALWSWWGSRSAATRDGELAVVFTVLSFAAPLSQVAPQFGDLPTNPASATSVLLTLGMTLPMAVRTRWPAACLAVAGTSFAVYESLGCPPSFGSLGLYIALYSAGAHQNRLRRVVAAVATAGYLAFAIALHELGSPVGLTDYLLFYIVLAVAFGLGAMVRG